MIESLSSLFLGSRLSVRHVSIKSMRPRKFTSILANVPPRPRSSWQIYMREHLKDYKSSNGKIDLKRAAEELGSKWQALSSTAKHQYESQYAKESKAHLEAYSSAVTGATTQQVFEENVLRKKYNLPTIKDSRIPKKPKNSFILFLGHLRQQPPSGFKDLTVAEQAREGGRLYKNLSQVEKSQYERQSKKESEAYLQTMSQFEAELVKKSPPKKTKK